MDVLRDEFGRDHPLSPRIWAFDEHEPRHQAIHLLVRLHNQGRLTEEEYWILGRGVAPEQFIDGR